MSQSISALEFIFNTKAFSGLEREGISYFSSISVGTERAHPELLTDEEMTHLQLTAKPRLSKDKNGAINERAFFLNEDQRELLEEYQLNQLPGFSPEKKAALVALKKEYLRLLFSEAIKDLPEEEKAAIAEQKKAFFESISSLIFSLEQNGNAKDHAQKLDKLFPNMIASAYYMGIWLATHQSLAHPLHDLCMAINFPKSPTSAFPTFREWGPLHSKAMFTDAKLLEKYTQHYQLLDSYRNSPGLSRASADDFASSIERAVMAKELGSIGNSLSDTEVKIVKQVVKTNERFATRAKYEDVGRILEVMRRAKNSNAVLPDITMSSKDLELGLFDGLTMRKLDMNDPAALMFGHLTGCCQRIKGMGESCAVHSVESDKGGVYVIEWKKAIMAGSWGWYSEENGTVCFDSVEIDSQNKKQVEDKLKEVGLEDKLSFNELMDVLYNEFAKRLMKANPNIQQVVVGTNGQTPAEIGLSAQSRFDMSIVSPDGYPKEGYRDSRTIRVLARRTPEGTIEMVYQLHALNKNAIIEKLFDDKTFSEEALFRLFANFLEDKKLINHYFTGSHTSIKTVTILPDKADLNEKTIYLIKGQDDTVTAHFYVGDGERGHWEQKNIAANKLPKKYAPDQSLDAGYSHYSTIEFLDKVTSLCGLTSSKIQTAGIEVPGWFKFVFDHGSPRGYNANKLQQLADLVKDAGFMLPDTTQTLFYAALERKNFACAHSLIGTLTKEIIDIGNETESCLILCAKNVDISLPDSDWYKMTIELFEKGGNPNYGDVDGLTVAHYLCSNLNEKDFTPFFMLAKKYQFDLKLNDDNGVTPLDILAKRHGLNTLSDIKKLIDKLDSEGIDHGMSYLILSKVIIINNETSELGLLQEFMKNQDFSQVDKNDIKSFFANQYICHEAKVIFFEKLLEQKSAFNTDDLSSYLNSMVITNIKEYEQLRGLFERANSACEKSLYSFAATLETNDEELIRLKEYMKQNPPSTAEFKSVIERYFNRFRGPTASFLKEVFDHQLESEEQQELFMIFFPSEADGKNLNSHKHDKLLCDSLIAFLAKVEIPYKDTFGPNISEHKELIKILEGAVLPIALSQITKRITEQSKEVQKPNDFSGQLRWLYADLLSSPNSNASLKNIKALYSHIDTMQGINEYNISEKFPHKEGQNFSATDFAELEVLCFVMDIMPGGQNSGIKRAFSENASTSLAYRFFKNDTVLEANIFNAMLERYVAMVSSLNKGKSNKFIETPLTNLMVRSALSCPEKICDDARKILMQTPAWINVRLEVFDDFFSDEYSIPSILDIESYVNFYLLGAQSKTERLERCNLLLNKLQTIKETKIDPSYIRTSIDLLCGKINNQAAHLKQYQSLCRDSFFNHPEPKRNDRLDPLHYTPDKKIK